MASYQDPEQLIPFAGQWIAMDRDLSQVIASGDSFAEVKTAAARRGRRSVLVAQLPRDVGWFRKSRRYLHWFAVFIAVAQAPGLTLENLSSTPTTYAVSRPDAQDEP